MVSVALLVATSVATTVAAFAAGSYNASPWNISCAVVASALHCFNVSYTTTTSSKSKHTSSELPFLLTEHVNVPTSSSLIPPSKLEISRTTASYSSEVHSNSSFVSPAATRPNSTFSSSVPSSHIGSTARSSEAVATGTLFTNSSNIYKSNYSSPTPSTSSISSTTLLNSFRNATNDTSPSNSSAISLPMYPNSTGTFHAPFEALSTKAPSPKAVFAHYLVGTVTAEHANQDIDEAMAMGLDGFALNIGDPSADFLTLSLDNIFGYAEYRDFKLFISMDVYASGNACASGRSGACGGPIAYEPILKGRLGSSSWYLGPNGFPLISTYSSGGEHNDTWYEWELDFASTMFFIPDFDETLGYYTADPGWYAYWGGLVDGTFSWESAWPSRDGKGGEYPGDISPDLIVQTEMTKNNKSYMIPLSSLQYKNSYGANVYRAGDLNLPIRMEKILAMDTPPDFVQVITWNDGPEGHYIGNLWLEQNNDTQPMRYANQIQFPHHPWQTLITPFIDAYKSGGKAIDMAPVDGSPAVGAIWYKTIMKSSVCPMAPNPNLYNATPPDSFDTATDTMSYAIVIPPAAPSYSLNAVSNGVVTVIPNLQQGLNYGSVDIQPGYQRMELVSGDQIILAATGGRCISAGCPDCVYNMNPQVIAFLPDTGDLGTCPYQACSRKVFAHYMVGTFYSHHKPRPNIRQVGNVYAEHAQKDIDDAAALGLDGFALNVGDPTQPFVRDTFKYMFDYTRDNHPNFKLFISMDLWAEGNAFEGVHIDYYYDLLRDFLGHPAWLLGPNGYPFISTYSSGGMTSPEWISWKNTLANELYFVPDFDDTLGYNTSDPGWWGYWEDIIDGAMSWETTWAKPGVGQAGDISVDNVVVTGTFQHRKSYMMRKTFHPSEFQGCWLTESVACPSPECFVVQELCKIILLFSWRS